MNLRKDHYRFATDASAKGETIQPRAATLPWDIGLPAVVRQVWLSACGYLAACALLTAHPEVLCAVVVTRVAKGGNSAFKEPRLRIGFRVPPVGFVNKGTDCIKHRLRAGNHKNNTIQWIIWLGGR